MAHARNVREMSDRNDDREPEPAPEARNPTEEASADVDSGTGVGERPDVGRDRRDESTRVANEERRRKTSVVSGLIAAIGAWVALSVLVFDVGRGALWNNVLVGAVVFVAAAYNTYRVTNDVPLSVGVSTLVAVLGIWLIVSAAVLGMLASPFWSTVAAGLLIAGLAGYNAYEAREARAVAAESETRV